LCWINSNKKYTSKTNLEKQEILSRIRLLTKTPSIFITSDCIVSEIKGNRIKLQKKGGWLRHPFQRFFTIDLSEENDITVIKGKFSFPLISKVIAVLFSGFMFYNNLVAIVKIENLSKKLMVSLCFMIFYLFIILLFISGKVVYQKQEKEVIDFLEGIVTTQK